MQTLADAAQIEGTTCCNRIIDLVSLFTDIMQFLKKSINCASSCEWQLQLFLPAVQDSRCVLYI